jgi:hypothetical protein
LQEVLTRAVVRHPSKFVFNQTFTLTAESGFIKIDSSMLANSTNQYVSPGLVEINGVWSSAKKIYFAKPTNNLNVALPTPFLDSFGRCLSSVEIRSADNRRFLGLLNTNVSTISPVGTANAENLQISFVTSDRHGNLQPTTLSAGTYEFLLPEIYPFYYGSVDLNVSDPISNSLRSSDAIERAKDVPGGFGSLDSSLKINASRLPETGVIPGSYDLPNLTVDERGRIQNITSAKEEGSFFPGLRGTGTAGTFTYATRVGRYQKLGNLVRFSFHLGISVAPNPAPTGNIRLTGLPYTMGTFYLGVVDFGYLQGSNITMRGYVLVNSNEVILVKSGSTLCVPGDFTFTGCTIIASGHYFIN